MTLENATTSVDAIGVQSGATTGGLHWIALTALAIDVLIFETLFEFGIGLLPALTVSFLVASVFSYIVGSRPAVAGAPRSARGPVSAEVTRFVVICLLGFGLRGGVFSDASQFLHWPPLASVLVGSSAATVVTYLGSRFFAFHTYARPLPTDRWPLAAFGAVAYMLALRLAYLGLVNLLPEEAYYWNFSQHLDIGYLDHPPMSALMIWLGTSLFGNSEFGVRIGAYLAWIAMAFFVYRLTANLFGKSTAVIGIVLTAMLPVFFYTGFMMTPDVPLTAAWAGALYFLERALVAHKRKAWWAVGVCAGLGMVSKYTIALLGPAALIFLILDPAARRWLGKPEPYIAAILALALFSPVIYWNAMHGWASFAFQSTQRLQDPAIFSTPSLVASAALLLTPLGLISAIAVLASPRRRAFLAPKGDIEARRRLLFITIFTAAPLSVFLAFSLAHQVKLDWTGPIWLAILPAVSAMILQAAQLSRFEDAIKRLWGPTLVGTLAIYAVFLHYLVLGLPFAGHLGNLRTLPVAWDEFGRQVGLVRQTVEKETGQSVLLAGMDKYFVASEIAFYDRQGPDIAQRSVGAGPFGNDSLMYGYWFKPTDMQGRTIILFGVKSSDVEQRDLGRYFERLTEIKTQTISKRGTPIGKFYYRVGYSYRGCSLPQTSCPEN
jgi:dolichol-phosphate mannosyltransferase